jgi:hypothetical protein
VSARKFRAVFSKRVAMARKRFKPWKKRSTRKRFSKSARDFGSFSGRSGLAPMTARFFLSRMAYARRRDAIHPCK